MWKACLQSTVRAEAADGSRRKEVGDRGGGISHEFIGKKKIFDGICWIEIKPRCGDIGKTGKRSVHIFLAWL